ncbi:hypothetical protein D3C85_1420460 [compost metagenome]
MCQDIGQRRRRLRHAKRLRSGCRVGARHLGCWRLISQVSKALLCDIEGPVARGSGVVTQALQVILDTRDRIGQALKLSGARLALPCQQVPLDIGIAGSHQAGGTVQGDHRQGATDLGQQFRQGLQPLWVPIRIDIVDDQILGLLQTEAGFLDHQLVDQGHVRGG